MKSIMSQSEYIGWMIYLSTKKPDTTEIQLATLSSLVSAGLGGKQKFTDFIVNKSINNDVSINPKSKANGMSASDIKSAFSGIATPMK